MQKIYLIGYEGCTSEQLVNTLKNVGVEVLADVRELPLSRKKGLSKTSLAMALKEENISYRHFRELGDPKEGRNAARSGNYQKFEEIFLDHFYKSPAQNALDELLEIASQNTTCMMCFERCSDVCHRSYIADEAIRRGFEVFNLVADRAEMYLKDGIKIPSYSPRKGLAAAE